MLGMWWLTCDGGVSLNLWNRSHTDLNHLLVTVGDRSVKFDHIGSGTYAAASVDSGFTFDIDVAFDAGGTHHHGSVRTHGLPFGDSILVVSIDDQWRVTAVCKPTFMSFRRQ